MPLQQHLPKWGISDFEPHISSETMFVHVNKLHKGYVDKLNARFGDSPILEIAPSIVLRNLEGYLPTKDQEFYRNMMGGNLAHALFWEVLNPKGSGQVDPNSLFMRECLQGQSLHQLKQRIVNVGLARFGSGWVWGCVDPRQDYKFLLYSTRNHDTPYMRGQIPIFTVDLWEHAYFIDDHGNRKAWLDTVVNRYLDFKLIQDIYRATKLHNFDVGNYLVRG